MGLGAGGLGYPWNSLEGRQWVKAAGCPACCQASQEKEEEERRKRQTPRLGTLPPPLCS